MVYNDMLSIYLSSVYTDGVVDNVRECRIHYVSVLLYADDILLLAPVTAL